MTISVTDPDTELTEPAVEAVMDTIVNTDAFTSNGGDIVSKVPAEIISRDADVIGEF